jgi:alpha,alpha-trehalase
MIAVPVMKPMLDHGAIGNGRVLALVSPTTRIDWLCMPRFDSPSVFARLLDTENGGSFGFDSPTEITTHMEYVPNTNVLRTRVTSSSGSYDLFDHAPRIPTGLGVDAPVEVHRLLVPCEGHPLIRVRFDPRPDYARAKVSAVQTARGLAIEGGAAPLFLASNVPVPYILASTPFRLDRPRYFVLSHGRASEIGSAAEAQSALEGTMRGWRAWVKNCALPSFAAPDVLRSALCLKLHAAIDTGAIIAAATTSIPEAIGTQRTWDYRYCWLRDSAFVVEALRRLSHLAEGEAFARFLRDVAEAGPLQPVYGVGGERDLTEEQLPHLAGFAGSGPVRVGNAAYEQKQNDLTGEMVLCLETMATDPRVVVDDGDGLVRTVERLVNDAIAAYPSTDTGIWEFRTSLRHTTFSKVMGWVAAHRGARLARFLGRNDLADKWSRWADGEYHQLLEAAFNKSVGFFTQTLGSEYPDSSNLLLATLGFVDPKDPRFVATVRAYERLLVQGGLMLRYRNPDDFGETTSAFTACSFWWAEALAMMGEIDAAVALFKRLLGYANPLGLFSEDVDPRSGALVGNFPQAYTHVGLIHAAITIGELLDARDAKFRAWT